MPWFAASVIAYARFADGRQTKYPMKERVLIVKAGSLVRARRKARRQISLFPGFFPYRGRRAKWCFGGIRRIVQCMPPAECGGVEAGKLMDGTELTCSQYLIKTSEDLKKFVDGAPVKVSYMQDGSWR